MKIAALVTELLVFLGNDLFMDILYNCAETYKQLMCTEYHIKFFVDNEIKELNLTFSGSEFKHLTGLEKLKDKTLIHDLSSSTLLDYIHNHRIVYDSSLYIDSPDVEISEQIIDSQFLNNPINNINKSNITYNLIDRINELTNLYNLLHNASNNSLSVFKWNGDFPKEKRPNHSDIKADLLLVFDNSVTQKTADETVCSFFIEEQDNKAAAVSIFPTNVSYSDDGVVPPLHQCKILSFDEHSISKSPQGIVQNVTVTSLIKCSNAELKAYEQIDKDEKMNKVVRSKLYGLNDTRKKFLKRLIGKFDINENIGYESEFSKYQARLEEIATSPKIDIEVKQKILDEIQNLRDKTDSKERLKLDSLDDEIRIINDSIEREIELSQKISQNIQSPIAALSSDSSALTDGFNNTSKNVQNFSLAPQYNQQFRNCNLHFSGQAAGAIALSPPVFPQPMFDLSKIITMVEKLNEKLSDFIHNIPASFKRSHTQAQEQPPQDRTARGRKINFSLPFPKEKPSQERTEPVTAKSEKALKPEVKFAEKQLGWLGNQLRSAKKEADEHNKNHEPKHHDIDKSL